MHAVHPSLSSRRLRHTLAGAAAATLVAMMMLSPAAAVASTGSIPPDVAAFASADEGLLLELEEYFGLDERGSGLDFSDGIELGAIDRVFLWSRDYHSGVATETPVQYVNRWKVPVLIGEEPVGVALIGFDPATVEPEMIDFIRNPGTALALDDVDNDATLIHEPETDAWFSLIGDVITPLVRGSSEVAGETTLAEYQSIVSTRLVEVVDEEPQPDQGSVQSVVLIVTTIGVVVLVLLLPAVLGKLRARRERSAENSEATGGVEADHESVPPAEEAVAPPSIDDEATAAVPRSAAKRSPRAKPVASEAATSHVGDSKKAASAKAENTSAALKKSSAKTTTANTTPAGKSPAAPKKSTTKAQPKSQTKTQPKAQTTATSATATKRPAAKSTSTSRTPQPRVTKAPAAKKPVAKKPAATKPVAKKPAAADSDATDNPAPQ